MSLKDDRVAELRTKLAAREGKPGLSMNAAAIREQIAMIEDGSTGYRSEITGQFVSLQHLIDNPITTERA